MKKYEDTTLTAKERAAALLAEMSLEEKMAQVVCCFPRKPGDIAEILTDYPVGAGHVSTLEMRSLPTLADCAKFQKDIQETIMAKSPHRIPAIFHMEGLCGAYLQDAASFPSGLGRASAWDPVLERQVGEIVGRQERAVGITETLAPVLDISRDARMGRRGETYGEDAVLASNLGCAYTEGLQGGETAGRRTEAVAKHFLGFHASQSGIHGTDCHISDRELREVYAKPFQAAVTKAGLRGVMPCYNILNGKPVSASRDILNGLLREEMGFDGITVSDYCALMNLHGIQGMYDSDTEAGQRAMEAGMDVELQFKYCFNDELADWFRDGKADIAVLDQAVSRVLEAKFRMGLFEHPFSLDGEELTKAFHSGTEKAVSLQAARESLVLLKNDGTLPLSRTIKKLAVIGPHAAQPRFFFGGYTHLSMVEGLLASISTMAGLQTEKGTAEKSTECFPGTIIERSDSPAYADLLKRQKPDCTSLLDELKVRLPETEIMAAYGYDFAGTDTRYFAEALEAAKQADAVLVTLGGKYGTGTIAAMGEGMDGTGINLPVCQEQFLEQLAELGKPVAAVHLDGRAISSDAADRCANAILEAWAPAEMGGRAIAEALVGEYNPGGKLPVSVAYHSGQLPIYYNHPNNSSYHQGGSIAFSEYVDCPHRPRYFFGHGLSYTSFAYSGLSVERQEAAAGAEILVSFTVENTGNHSGDEIAQFYWKDVYASRARPVLELAGFARVTLLPGERKKITFTAQESQLAFLNDEMKWQVERGEVEIRVGSSSEDIRLTGKVALPESYTVEGRTRGFWAEVSVDAV